MNVIRVEDFPQFFQSLHLQLPDPLLGDAKIGRDLSQSSSLPVTSREPKSFHENLMFSLVKNMLCLT